MVPTSHKLHRRKCYSEGCVDWLRQDGVIPIILVALEQ